MIGISLLRQLLEESPDESQQLLAGKARAGPQPVCKLPVHGGSYALGCTLMTVHKSGAGVHQMVMGFKICVGETQSFELPKLRPRSRKWPAMNNRFAKKCFGDPAPDFHNLASTASQLTLVTLLQLPEFTSYVSVPGRWGGKED